MSWFVGPVQGKDDKVLDALEKTPVQGQDAKEEHVGEAVAAAIRALDLLIASDAVGEAGTTYSVSASGHANPDHKPVEGWANDTISVSITQV